MEKNSNGFSSGMNPNTDSSSSGFGDIFKSVNQKEQTSTSNKHQNIYDALDEEIMKSDMSDADKAASISRLLKLRGQKVNILLAGATGSGKSSTINALFNMDVAKVGVGVDPETQSISKYELENMTIWDTPGLGDSIENDERIKRSIIAKLNEIDGEHPLIDMVLVIIDASSKDLGTSYDLINNVLVPCFGKDAKNRILIALNQSDIAMKGTHWNAEKNEPDEVLQAFLRKKAESIKTRIKGATDIDIKPIYYCAGYKEEGSDQRNPYNLTKLLYFIVKAIPAEKRLVIIDNLNKNEENWLYDDKEENYEEKTEEGIAETLFDCISDWAGDGADAGEVLLGIPGKIVGGALGGIFGGTVGVLGLASGVIEAAYDAITT